MHTKSSKMSHNVNNMTKKEKNSKIQLNKQTNQLTQIKIHITITKVTRNVHIKTTLIITAISKRKMTFSGITPGSIQARVNFGRRLRDSKNKVKRNTKRRKRNGPASKRKKRMTQTRNGMAATPNKKKTITKNTMKVTCSVGARTITNTLRVPQTQTIRSTTTLIPCSTELSSTAKGSSQRSQRITVSTYPRKIPISTNRTVEQTPDQIFLAINICHGYTCSRITLSKSAITKRLINLKDKTHCSNRPKSGLILKRPKA